MSHAVIVDSIRTGLAKSFRGSFNLTRSDDMVAHLINALLDRNPKVDASRIDDVILGAANQTGEQSFNLARMAAVLSRLPIETTGTTVSRFCASGLQTIAMAAQQIDSGFTDIMMAGGVESISMRQRQQPQRTLPLASRARRSGPRHMNRPTAVVETAVSASVTACGTGREREGK